MDPLEISQVPVFILCGGVGTRIKEDTEFRPKPMVPIGEHPILWHIMRTYARHGFRRFVLCLGFKSDYVKNYFRNFAALNSDCTINLRSTEVVVHERVHDYDWDVTLAFTGEKNMTGSRVAQAARKYLGSAQTFAVTYGDGLTDVDLAAQLKFHVTHGRSGTVLGVNPPSRFGELRTEGEIVHEFSEKPDLSQTWINGGYFFFQRSFLPYLSEAPDCILERTPLAILARDRQLAVFKHAGFWACMDTQRDREELTQMVDRGETPWLG
jgi:glucose-1-phosphate cytidylyltransferase